MREILFKAKKLNNGEWIEGYYFAKPVLNYHCILEGENQWQIDPSTLCQFTGLTDKNGDKIWENDIVDVLGCWWNPVSSVERDLVKWDDSKSGFFPYVWCNTEYDMYYYPEASEVIGNKFDNFGLLEE